MSDQRKVAGDRSGDAARPDRLRAALRENLKRRKAQARGRSSVNADEPHDSAGIARKIAPSKPKG